MTEGLSSYYPPGESAGGWRYLRSAAEVREIGGMDAAQLDLARQMEEFRFGGDSWSIVIIRRGYLVREFYTFNVLVPSRFDIWSGTKSFTGLAWGLLLEDGRQGRLPRGRRVDLDSRAYELIPEGHPLSDPRKSDIAIRHLLTMTSGIPGESAGIAGMPTATGVGPFEHALGRAPNRFGRSVATLAAEPGTRWDYSDAAFCHLALAFAHVMGQEMAEVLAARVLAPIGVENCSWDVQGGSGAIGPHTNAHTGVHISARELARVGYLALHQGAWQGKQLVPAWWMEMATRPSQELNPAYGYTWWNNANGSRYPGVPRDAFALSGYRGNTCCIIPSLDLVIARIGSGPVVWDPAGFFSRVAGAVV